jgi:hypothetical protein
MPVGSEVPMVTSSISSIYRFSLSKMLIKVYIANGPARLGTAQARATQDPKEVEPTRHAVPLKPTGSAFGLGTALRAIFRAMPAHKVRPNLRAMPAHGPVTL